MKKLAIVGSGPETRGLAPYNDETFDIWVLNEAPLAEWCKRYTASFQMHVPQFYTAPNTKVPGYWEWLQQPHGKPVYMQAPDGRVPDCKVYPLQDAIKLAGSQYLTSTISQALALALLQGYEQVDIYGVQMSFTEYGYQAECYRFWIGYLRGRLGTENVILHDDTGLFTAPLYGYAAALTFDKAFFDGRVTALDNQWNSADKNVHNIKAVIEKNISRKEYKKVGELIGKYEDAATIAGEASGALAQAEKYAEYSTGIDRNTYEQAAAKAQTEGDKLRTTEDHTGGMVEYVWNVWLQTKGNPQAEQQLRNILAKLGECAFNTGIESGVYQENISYILKYDDLVKAGRYDD